MMHLLQFSARLLPKYGSLCNVIKRGAFFILPFFLFFCCTTPASGQVQLPLRQDTITLALFEYVQLHTNNGSACVFYASNASNADIATLVNTGAPDSLVFDDKSFFNGIHHLAPGQQLIAVGNFMGKQIASINLSEKGIPITVMLFCPN